MVLGIQRMSRLALEERSLWSMYVIGTETGDFDVVFREIIGMFCAVEMIMLRGGGRRSASLSIMALLHQEGQFFNFKV
jgi:hypothetical protein